MSRRGGAATLIGGASIALGLGAADAGERPAWPGTFLGRVEALAVMQSLNATLLASRSATFTLETWCADHKLADEPRLVATLKRDVDKPVTAEQRQRLQIGPDESVKYRRVLLSCGDRVLSEADNWYVPGRLTPEMNTLLETTTTPFGRAVQALQPTRKTFAAELHWSPLPAGWKMTAIPPETPPGPLAIPDKLFEHRALLFTADQKPFSEVDETYTAEILAFAPPAETRP